MVHSILVLAVLLTPQEKALYADLPQIFSQAETRASDLLKAVDVPDRPDVLFPGALWCLYEATGKDSWKRAARTHTECLDPVRQGSGDPDSGLVAYRAYGNGLRLVEPLGYREALIDAAQALKKRSVALGDVMNLELLQWAVRWAGDAEAGRIARSSADHAVSAGLARTVYGFTMMYRETEKDHDQYLARAIEAADESLGRESLSDAAILASALLELSGYAPAEKAKAYRAFAVRALSGLASGDCADYYFLEALLRFRKLAEQRSERERVAEIANMLPGTPSCVGFAPDSTAASIATADAILKSPLPPWVEEDYLAFWKTGDRKAFESNYFARVKNLNSLVLAERQEGNGRFLAKITEYLETIAAERCWVMAAHDHGGHPNFDGRRYFVDLGAANRARYVSLAVASFRDRLPPETVKKVRTACEKFVFGPYRETLRRMNPDGRCYPTMDKGAHWWFDYPMNWNAVCNANVWVAALNLVEDRTERARLIVLCRLTAEQYLRSFTPDGYCSEGMGYWNYGFGEFIRGALAVREATHGGIDLFKLPRAKEAMAYAFAYPIGRDFTPPFADGNGNPNPGCLEVCRAEIPEIGTAIPPVSFFDFSQVCVARSEDGDAGFAAKGGHNHELHNHCDVGSYAVMKDGQEFCGDPGNETYTRFTFSDRRYESKVLNSYGHPVPVVDGKLQGVGGRYRGRVLERSEADGHVVYSLDLTGAYDAPGLRELVRTFVFDSKAKTLVVTDRVCFDRPRSFETALVAHVPIDSLNVNVRSTCGMRVTRDETIPNPGRKDVYRRALAFSNPVSAGEISVVYRLD